ncbi:hypothetical protein AAG570_001970, partial [Ranatra chinensis]
CLQELLSKGNKRRTTLVIIGVVALAVALVVVVVLLKAAQPGAYSSSKQAAPSNGIPLQGFIRGEYSPQRFNGTWISDYEVLYRSKDGSFMTYNAWTKQSQQLMSGDYDLLKSVFHYELSADRRYLMLAHSFQKMYRHTFLAYYHIVDLETKKDWPVMDVNGNQILIQLVVWAPVGNAYAYVYLNDIYYRSSPREQLIQEYRLTHTGRPGTIYNGVPDWVYEEEILSSNTALWFSQDSQYIAYATFNDSSTPVMNIPYYGPPGDLRFQYTQSVNIRYPKPGRPNPTVSLSVVKLSDLSYQAPVKQIDIPPTRDLKEPVLNSVTWASPRQLLVVWMNRVQNRADVVVCSVEDTNCRLVLSPEEKSGWVVFEEPLFSADGSQMVVIQPHDQGGNAGAYQHVTLVDLTGSTALKPVPLTEGKFVVTELIAWDQETSHIYFLSNVEGSPGQLRLNRVSDKREGAPHKAECISCSNEILNGPECLYSGAVFSKNNSFYAQTCVGPSIPEVAIFSKMGNKVTNWETNTRLKTKLAEKAMPVTEQLKVPIGDDMFAYVKLFLPPNMDKSGNTKYPLLIQVYGGPDSSQISERFNVAWHTYLTVNQNIIYAMIDGRGSGLKGHKMLFANYRHLGTLEIQDQINVTKYLLKNKKYIDKDKTAIWGWSYGGYATGMVLANDTKGVFKCGIAVAPVSDWLLYDTLYTERYMGLPTLEDNLYGYEVASLNNKIRNFKNKRFLLIHGTLDDNVHYQQSMMLAKSLEMNDILFDQQSYPDEGHGLVDVQPHLYHMMQHFLKQCYDHPTPD